MGGGLVIAMAAYYGYFARHVQRPLNGDVKTTDVASSETHCNSAIIPVGAPDAILGYKYKTLC